MIASVLAFGALSLALIGPVRAVLVRLRVLERAPRAGIALFQSLALASALALAGAVVSVLLVPFGSTPAAALSLGRLVLEHPSRALTPNELFALTAGLIVATLASSAIAARAVGLLRARAHHRLLIDLVGGADRAAPGVLVVPHERALAYCVPGRRARIVVSSAALGLLEPGELAAVLAHERAHVRARHHLVLFPYLVAASLFGGSRAARALRETVAGLVEMAADDRALHEVERAPLARALCRLGTGPVPDLALGATGSPTLDRVERLIGPPHSSWPIALWCGVASVALASSPLLVAFGWR